MGDPKGDLEAHNQKGGPAAVFILFAFGVTASCGEASALLLSLNMKHITVWVQKGFKTCGLPQLPLPLGVRADPVLL